MTIDSLPGDFTMPERQTLVDSWKQSHRTLVPDADTGPNTQPDVDARIAADAVLALYVAARRATLNAVLEEATGDAALQWGEREGVGEKRDAIGASGYVTITASAGGGTIQDGDELVHEPTGLVFRAIGAASYQDGEPAPVVGVDTGPGTNLAAGVVLQWSSPRPGIFAKATVLEQSDGSGLSGGREAETDEEYVERIAEEKRTRAASGNDAEYQVEAQKTPAVAVQKAFTYPALFGPGTQCLAFTMRPGRPGGARAPNAAQIALVEEHLVGKFPADDGFFAAATVEEDVDVVFGVTWAEGAQGWEDLVQWPPYYATSSGGNPGAIVVTAATATTFTLATNDSDYTGVPQPQVGQTLAFYDTTNGRFVRKRILSFTGTGPWVITIDTTNGVSDTSYIPVVGQRACPWADSLNAMISRTRTENGTTIREGLLVYFDGLGPGEMFASFYDEGRRQKRIPRPTRDDWPHTLTGKGLENAVDSGDLEDVTALEGDGATPSVGTPGVSTNLLRLRYVAVFPEA